MLLDSPRPSSHTLYDMLSLPSPPPPAISTSALYSTFVFHCFPPNNVIKIAHTNADYQLQSTFLIHMSLPPPQPRPYKKYYTIGFPSTVFHQSVQT